MRNIKKTLLLIILPCLLMSGFVYVYAVFVGVVGGYKLGPSSQGIYKSNALTCSVAMNDGIGKSYFVPTHSSVEITAFEAHTPSDITIFSDAQPQCGTDLDIQCQNGDVVWSSSPLGYDCGPGDIDRCYDWNCESTCGLSDPCGFVDEGAGTACFVVGTPITLADGSQKVIEDITVGDTLVGMGDQTNTVQKLVKKLYTRNLYSINGSDYFVTDNHLFLTAEGWKAFDAEMGMIDHPGMIVGTLEIGDVLFTEDGPVQIVSLASRTSSEYVYSFEADGNHTYYSHGYLVHNSSIPQ